MSWRLFAIRVFILHLYKLEVRRPFRSDNNYDALPVSALVDHAGAPYCPWCGNLCADLSVSRTFVLDLSASRDLATLTFDLETGACYWSSGGQPSYQCWCFFAFSLSTYRPTPVRRIAWPCDLDLWPWRSRRMSVIRVLVISPFTKFEVLTSSDSEDTAHLLCEY